jgi:hypothetical protein
LPKSKRAGIKEWLKEVFKRNPCHKIISYQGTSWKVSASVDAAKVVTVDLKELTKHVHEVTSATNHAKLLDDFQVLFCLDIEKWAHDVNYVNILRRFRIVAIAYIIRLAEILEDIKVDLTNKALKRELVRISVRMTGLIEQFENTLLRDA